ncbi:RecQ family ATP-dependent DNA helicase, partial [Balneolaceae bacterium ANBcel3]|nr:RecQ family ATP-dependent DNA helicase [Balneolaceae bacterium ANBcel3]
MTTPETPTKVFEQEFPKLYQEFQENDYELKEFQNNVINHVICEPTTLAVMPTGGGKSLIYWISARAAKGTCLIVSPLIALLDEQAEKLEEQGFEVLAIHSGMGASEQMKQLKAFANGEFKPDFIFVSPERLATDGFFEYCMTVQKDRIKLLVVDEVHCISQWGFDFRPFYKHIPNFLNRVFNQQWPKVLGLTATLNPQDLKEIAQDFKIPRTAILKDQENLLRTDIDLKVKKFAFEDEKEDYLWQLLSQYEGEKILVYLYKKYGKRGVDQLTEKAIENGYKALSFHGDLSSKERQDIIGQFKSGEKEVIFATNAFGMGIDIPDIRIVIHFMIPESIEQYYQEIGRAGRDGNGAISYLLFTNKNVSVKKSHFINKSFPKDEEQIKSLFERATNSKTGYRSLQFFEEEELQSALPYFLNSSALSIAGKGFTSLNVFENVENQKLKMLLDASRTGMVIPLLKKRANNDQGIRDFFDTTYSAVVNNQAKFKKNKKLYKCLIINAVVSHLTNEQLSEIEDEIQSKKKYKHDLLDILVALLDNYDWSKSLHQEIGRYLGVPKHLLGKIHE